MSPEEYLPTQDTFADPTFSETIITWQKQYGRHSLPWQNTRDPYRVWLSEIMLQQTQVSAVIPYYQKFLARFPTLESLANAASEDVMAHWSGLGYYTRARNLHRCARRVVHEYAGVFPRDPQLLQDLPGIGKSTAAAIAAFSYGVRAAILDGNVKRVFARVFGIDGYPGLKPVEKFMWQRATAVLPKQDIEAYTQGLMDLGATLCTRSKPSCVICPLAARCIALATDTVAQRPVPKPQKVIPEKKTRMLIMIHDNQVLLEQRPNSGIWGGLLSLPEMDTTTSDAHLMCAAAVFGNTTAYKALPSFTHVFTHFKLHISPVLIKLDSRLPMIAQSTQIWYETSQLAGAPLPAPVKKLLLSICKIKT